MGAILDITEMLKEPSWHGRALVVVAAGYFLVKWVFAEHPDDENKPQKIYPYFGRLHQFSLSW